MDIFLIVDGVPKIIAFHKIQTHSPRKISELYKQAAIGLRGNAGRNRRAQTDKYSERLVISFVLLLKATFSQPLRRRLSRAHCGCRSSCRFGGSLWFYRSQPKSLSLVFFSSKIISGKDQWLVPLALVTEPIFGQNSQIYVFYLIPYSKSQWKRHRHFSNIKCT